MLGSSETELFRPLVMVFYEGAHPMLGLLMRSGLQSLLT